LKEGEEGRRGGGEEEEEREEGREEEEGRGRGREGGGVETQRQRERPRGREAQRRRQAESASSAWNLLKSPTRELNPSVDAAPTALPTACLSRACLPGLSVKRACRSARYAATTLTLMDQIEHTYAAGCCWPKPPYKIHEELRDNSGSSSCTAGLGRHFPEPENIFPPPPMHPQPL
jgi:hypothetical protein